MTAVVVDQPELRGARREQLDGRVDQLELRLAALERRLRPGKGERGRRLMPREREKLAALIRGCRFSYGGPYFFARSSFARTAPKEWAGDGDSPALATARLKGNWGGTRPLSYSISPRDTNSQLSDK